MANELKKLVVKEMVARYRKADNYLVVGYQGINALRFDELRKDLRKKNISLEIVKNSLAAIAFKEVGNTGVVGLLKGPSAIVTGGVDPVVMAKETIEWSKKIPFWNLRGGFIDGTVISVGEVNNLAKLPSMPVLRAQIVTGINAPIVGVVNAFNVILRNLANVLQVIKDKKEESGV